MLFRSKIYKAADGYTRKEAYEAANAEWLKHSREKEPGCFAGSQDMQYWDAYDIPESSHMEPIYEYKTETEKVWVED